MGNRLLITGGSGYLGQHIVREATRRGHQVVVVARDRIAHARQYGGGAQVVAGDIRDYALLRDLGDGCDCVVHAAATTFRRSRDLHEYVSVNSGTQNVLRAASKRGVKRLIHVSTFDCGIVPAANPQVRKIRAGFDNIILQTTFTQRHLLKKRCCVAPAAEWKLLSPVR